MTGEMYWIDQNGYDSNGDCYELHAKVAKELGKTSLVFPINPNISVKKYKNEISSIKKIFYREIFNQKKIK